MSANIAAPCARSGSSRPAAIASRRSPGMYASGASRAIAKPSRRLTASIVLALEQPVEREARDIDRRRLAAGEGGDGLAGRREELEAVPGTRTRHDDARIAGQRPEREMLVGRVRVQARDRAPDLAERAEQVGDGVAYRVDVGGGDRPIDIRRRDRPALVVDGQLEAVPVRREAVDVPVLRPFGDPYAVGALGQR